MSNNIFATEQCYPVDLYLSGMNNEARAKLLRKPWSRQDVMKEKKAEEKRKQIVERFRKKWRNGK